MIKNNLMYYESLMMQMGANNPDKIKICRIRTMNGLEGNQLKQSAVRLVGT